MSCSEMLLQVDNLQTVFRTRRGVIKAVDGISFHVREGETLGIVGESGSGKTMTGFSILRLIPQPAGKVTGGIVFRGINLLELNEEEMRSYRGRRIAMILQDPMGSLNPVYTIGEQVAEPLREHQGLRGSKVRQAVVSALRLLQIPSPEERLRNYPHELSGGMRQRVVGGIAISCRPELMIADEPTTALDATVQLQYLALLKNLQRATNFAMIFITHDLGIVARMCDRVAVMYAGKIVETAPVRELFENPRHEYTRGLLDSVPRLDQKAGRLSCIEGQPPALTNLPDGCRFRPRCPRALAICNTQESPMVQVGPDHTASCWKAV